MWLNFLRSSQVNVYFFLLQLSDLQKQRASSSPVDQVLCEPLFKCPFKTRVPTDRVKVQPRINFSAGMIASRDAPISPRVQHEAPFFQRETFLDLPRRLRLIYFWASTRVVQRFIMVNVLIFKCDDFWYCSGKIIYILMLTIENVCCMQTGFVKLSDLYCFIQAV